MIISLQLSFSFLFFFLQNRVRMTPSRSGTCPPCMEAGQPKGRVYVLNYSRHMRITLASKNKERGVQIRLGKLGERGWQFTFGNFEATRPIAKVFSLLLINECKHMNFKKEQVLLFWVSQTTSSRCGTRPTSSGNEWMNHETTCTKCEHDKNLNDQWTNNNCDTWDILW